MTALDIRTQLETDLLDAAGVRVRVYRMVGSQDGTCYARAIFRGHDLAQFEADGSRTSQAHEWLFQVARSVRWPEVAAA